MIRLDISDYCNDCYDFAPDVSKPERVLLSTFNDDKTYVQSDTIVRCCYAKRCESIKRYLERCTQQEKHL